MRAKSRGGPDVEALGRSRKLGQRRAPIVRAVLERRAVRGRSLPQAPDLGALGARVQAARARRALLGAPARDRRIADQRKRDGGARSPLCLAWLGFFGVGGGAQRDIALPLISNAPITSGRTQK